MDDYWKHRGDETYAASVEINSEGKDEKSAAGVATNQAEGSQTN